MTAQPNPPRARNVALDNLRVVAMLLGLVTHGALPYTATGIVGFPVRDRTRHVAADACFFAVHDFRMQLFFLLAGFAAAALASRRGVGELVRNRVSRVALPLTCAVLTVCPAMHLLFARHAAARGHEWDVAGEGGWVGPNFHLWFLYYLLMCAAPLIALCALSPRFPPRVVARFDSLARGVLQWRWKVPAAAAFAVPLLWGMPSWWIDTPRGWQPDLEIYAYYLGFFFTGAVLYRHSDLLAGVGRRWRLYLLGANAVILPVMLKLTVSGNWAEEAARGVLPAWLVLWKAVAILLGGFYTWLMIAALVGLFQRHFSTSGRWQKYLADASYWCYLAGFPVQAGFQVWLASYRFPILPEFLLVNALTFAVLLASYESCVRHTWLGLMLNGRRPERSAKPEAVVIEARVGSPTRAGERRVPAKTTADAA